MCLNAYLGGVLHNDVLPVAMVSNSVAYDVAVLCKSKVLVHNKDDSDNDNMMNRSKPTHNQLRLQLLHP